VAVSLHRRQRLIFTEGLYQVDPGASIPESCPHFARAIYKSHERVLSGVLNSGAYSQHESTAYYVITCTKLKSRFKTPSTLWFKRKTRGRVPALALSPPGSRTLLYRDLPLWKASLGLRGDYTNLYTSEDDVRDDLGHVPRRSGSP